MMARSRQTGSFSQRSIFSFLQAWLVDRLGHFAALQILHRNLAVRVSALEILRGLSSATGLVSQERGLPSIEISNRARVGLPSIILSPPAEPHYPERRLAAAVQ
jgi:hypothetical protein